MVWALSHQNDFYSFRWVFAWQKVSFLDITGSSIVLKKVPKPYVSFLSTARQWKLRFSSTPVWLLKLAGSSLPWTGSFSDSPVAEKIFSREKTSLDGIHYVTPFLQVPNIQLCIVMRKCDRLAESWYIPYSSLVQPSDFGVRSVEAWCAADQYGHSAVYLCGQGLFWYLIFWFCLLPAIFGMLKILMLSSTTRLGAWLSFPLVQSLTAEGSFDVWSQLWTAIQVQLA